MTPGHRSTTAAALLARAGARRPAGLALAAAALLAACGGSSSPGDTTPPTVAITDSVSAATATADVTFSFTFSEDVGTSFVAADVAVTGGTRGTFTRVASTLYTLVVTPTPQASGTILVTVAAGAFQDVAGNASTAAATASQAYDTRVASTQMTLPVTFDSPTVEYGLLGFEGAEDSSIVTDPTGGTNKVAKVVKSATAQTFAGTTLTAGTNPGFASKVPFDAANTRMTVRVYSPDAGIQVRLKVEDHANPTISVETEATTTTSNAWETLTFDFANQATGTAALVVANTYDKATIFFNFGVNGATAGVKTYYFDDVIFIGGGGLGGGGAAFATVTFDDAAVTYVLTGFAGAEDSTVVTDPAGGTNKVVQVVRSAGAATFAGTTVSTGADNTVGKIPFDAANTRMTVRVWSPDAGIPVRLKVEDHTNGGISVETEATTTTSNAWEMLTFDFANPATGPALVVTNTYDRATIFFNFGVAGSASGAKTYFFDDLTFIGGGGLGGGGTPFATVTFDDAAVTYTLSGFAGADDSTVAVDPTGGTNKVAKVVRSATALTFAGTTFSTGPGNTVGTIPFSATRKSMSVRVFSPDAGIQVRLKVEDAADPTHSVETEATTATANAWETLTFDFANQAPGTAALDLGFTFNRATIFFNFGVDGATAGAKTYYFDDATFLP
jgi:hypothetical protein